jgi:hypothetical protein
MKLVRNSPFSLAVKWILLVVFVFLGINIFKSPFFAWNIPALLAYIAFVSILISTTPTQRGVLPRIWSILRNKKRQSIICKDVTLTSISGSGFNIKEVDMDNEGQSGFRFMMMKSRTDGLWYIPLSVSGMANYWTSNQDLEAHNMEVKACMNLLDGGEKWYDVNMRDLNVVMIDLAEELRTQVTGDDELDALTYQRHVNLQYAGSEAHKTLQQYIVLGLRKKSIGKVIGQLNRVYKLSVPNYPVDVVLAAMGNGAGLYLEESEPKKQAIGRGKKGVKKAPVKKEKRRGKKTPVKKGKKVPVKKEKRRDLKKSKRRRR